MSSAAFARSDPVNFHSAMLTEEEYYDCVESCPYAVCETTYDHHDDRRVSTVVFSRFTGREGDAPDDWEDGPCDTCGEQITWDGVLEGFMRHCDGGREWVCSRCRKAEVSADE